MSLDILLSLVPSSSSPESNIIIFMEFGITYIIDGRNLQVIGIYGCADPVKIHSEMTLLGLQTAKWGLNSSGPTDVPKMTG